MTTRRTLLAIVAALSLVAAACGSEDGSGASTTTAADSTAAPTDETTTSTTPEPLERLRIHHPETLAFAAPFTMLDPDGPLSAVADTVEIDVWTTPDVLRSLLVNGDTDVTAVPTYVGANLANRGVDVRMAAVVVWGLLWVIGPDGTPADWESLRGQTVMVPFQNDMPDLVFRYLADANGLTPGEDFTIEYYAQPPEVVARLIQGNGTWAVLPEHVATVALTQAGQNGRSLTRVMDLQSEWASATGGSPRIPQAGIVVPGSLADERPDVVAALLDEMEAAVATVNAADEATVAALSEASGVPAPLVTQIIPRLNLDVVPGGDAQAELERFFTELAALSPDIIGGELPADSFYLADPR